MQRVPWRLGAVSGRLTDMLARRPLTVLALMAGLLLALLGVVAYDLVTRPRDIWAAMTFAAGSLTASALGRWRRGRRGG